MKFRTYIGDLGFTSFPHFLSNQMDLNKTSRSKKEKLPKKKKKKTKEKEKRKKEKKKKKKRAHTFIWWKGITGHKKKPKYQT